MDRKGKPAGMEGIPTDFEDLATTTSGLDWGDVEQIRQKLALTPTERLAAAQDLINTALRLRAQHGDPAPD